MKGGREGRVIGVKEGRKEGGREKREEYREDEKMKREKITRGVKDEGREGRKEG